MSMTLNDPKHPAQHMSAIEVYADVWCPFDTWASTTSLSIGLRWDVEMFSWISGLGPSSW